MAAILVVEADTAVARDLAGLMRQMGHTVDIADSGEDALCKAEARSVDLAVVDTVRDGPLNAVETAAILKEERAVSIIYAATRGDAATLDRVKATKPFGYLQKPFKEADVYSSVEIALYLRGIEHELTRRAEQLAILEDESTHLRGAERLAAIGETAALLGHDLRNPLQVLTNLTYSAKKAFNEIPSPFMNDENKRKALDFCAAAEKQILYLDKIVSNVQYYARETHPNKRSIIVYELISDALSRVIVPDNITVSIHIDRDAESLNGDPLRLSRVCANLIQNATQAMPRGGRVTITAKKRAHELAISVADEGTGISKADLKSIFRPLETNKAQGMGFGLAVCDKLVKEHGGCIEVDSAVGEGSTFTVLLPLDTE